MNLGTRQSSHLDDHAVENLLRAADLAVHLGYGLNWFLSINREMGGIDGDTVHAFISKFCKYAYDWLRTKRTQWCCIWVLENPSFGGLNWHLVFYMPDDINFNFLQTRCRIWAKNASVKLDDNVLELIKIKGLSRRDRQGYGLHLNRTVAYVLKGSTERARDAIHIDEYMYFQRPDWREAESMWRADQGSIVGKRSGTSQAIGQKAQAAFRAEIAAGLRKPPRLPFVCRPIWSDRDLWNSNSATWWTEGT